MKNALIVVVIAMLAITAFTGAVAASGDENHWGAIGEQPAPGADDSQGPGAPNTEPPEWPPRPQDGMSP